MQKVSIIVPAYNVENYIERCIESLLSQTLKEIEIIIVNDGSTDQTKEKILPYKKKYPEKVIYLEKENGGLSSARNYGMPYAKGEYIAFIDSDDYVEKDMYEEMYKEAKNKNADMVECDFLWEYPKKIKEDHGVLAKNKSELITINRVVAWNKLIKREIIEKAKVEFPMGLRYEDVEFFYKLVPYLERVSLINRCFVHYVQRSNSIANTQNIRTMEIFTVLENVIKYYKDKGFYDKYKEELEYIYTRFLLCSSLKRMIKIKDKKDRKLALKKTWENLNSKFPDWEKNRILNENKNMKNMYIKFVGLIKRCNIISFEEEAKTRRDWLQVLMSLFILISPILDILSFVFRNKFETNLSPTTFLRPIIPTIIFTYLFFKGKNKKRIFSISMIYAIYACIHLYLYKNIITESSYGNLKSEMQYLINYSFMIIVLYDMYEVFKDKDKKILKNSVLGSILIYTISIFISIITKTSSTTYLEGTGYKGLFESGNSLCTVIIIGLCIISTINDNKKILSMLVFILSAIYLVIFSGTRTGIIGVLIVGTIFILSDVLLNINKRRINKKKIICYLAMFITVIIIFSTFGLQVIKRRQELKNNNQQNLDPETGEVRNVTGDILSIYRKIEDGQISEKYMSKAGQKSVCDLYVYAKDKNLSNVDLRKQQLIYNVYLVKNQKNIFLILFGNGYKAQFRELVMEMEAVAILLNFGIIGFILYLGPFIFILENIVYLTLKNREIIDKNIIMYITGLSLGLALSTLAGYVFFNQSSMIMMCVISVLVLEKKDKILFDK